MEVVKPSLTQYQKDILFCDARFTVTEASTKVGKTHSHIIWLFGKSMEKDDADGHNYWWVAPVYNQAKIAYKRLKRNLLQYGVFSFNESNLIITNPNGAEIHFKSAEKPDNLYGEDVYAAVFDEAPRARVESWYALRSTLTATNAHCKLIGNFGGVSNWVHKLKVDRKDDPQYQYFKVTCWEAVEAGILSMEEVQQAKLDLPPKIFKELYEAEPSEDKGQLISNESIQKIFSNTHLEGGIKYITADIARLGNDKTVVMVWDNFKLIDCETLDVSTITQTVELIKKLQIKYNVNNSNTICDEDGVGGGVVDSLRCLGFVNNSKPISVKGKLENFSNLKTQCYYKLAETINRNEVYVNLQGKAATELMEELEWVRLPKEVDTSKISLLSKDEIKKQIGRSPDYSDALMMRMFFDVNPNKGKYFIY